MFGLEGGSHAHLLYTGRAGHATQRHETKKMAASRHSSHWLGKLEVTGTVDRLERRGGGGGGGGGGEGRGGEGGGGRKGRGEEGRNGRLYTYLAQESTCVK